MTNKTYTYRRGTILLLEAGEYSDYQYVGQLVTLCDLDLKKAMADYKEILEVEKKDWLSHYRNMPGWDPNDTVWVGEENVNGFVGWLCATQKCAGLDCQTAHIGSYGKLEIEE